MTNTYKMLCNGKHTFDFYHDGTEWIEDYYIEDSTEKSGLLHVHRVHGQSKEMIDSFVEKLLNAGFKAL